MTLTVLLLRLFSLAPPQELNVRQLTLSTDKDKYGIRLRAEPDHMVLGKRLKGAFKAVTASIKELTSEQLEAFQKKGSTARISNHKSRTISASYFGSLPQLLKNITVNSATRRQSASLSPEHKH